MYKLCKTEQSVARQRQLEQGLMELMLQKSFEDISITELCQHLGITRKTFYRFFSGKDGCLYAMLDHTMLDFFTNSPVPGRATGNALGDLDQFFLFWYSRQRFLEALQKSGKLGILLERAIQLATREQIIPKYLSSWHLDLQDSAMAFAISGLYSMLTQWQSQGFLTPPEEMAKVATRMLTKPLIPI